MVPPLTAPTVISLAVAVPSWLLASNATSPVKPTHIDVQDTWLTTILASAARASVSVSIPFLAFFAIFSKYVERRSGSKQADRTVVTIAVSPVQVLVFVLGYVFGHISAGCNATILYLLGWAQTEAASDRSDTCFREQQIPGGWPFHISFSDRAQSLPPATSQKAPRTRKTNRYGLIDGDTSDSEELEQTLPASEIRVALNSIPSKVDGHDAHERTRTGKSPPVRQRLEGGDTGSLRTRWRTQTP